MSTLPLVFAAETVTDILLSWPHWVAEFTVEAITAILVYRPARWAWNRWHSEHDRSHHSDITR